MTAPSTSLSQPPPQRRVPIDVIAEGITQNSTAIVQQGLDLFASSRIGLDAFSLDRALSLAVRLAKLDIVRYIIDKTDVKVEGFLYYKIDMAMNTAGEEPAGKVIEVLDVLVEKGWDINRSGQGG